MPKFVKVAMGDIVKLKKAHPCGGFEWEVTRTGMDIGLKCGTCGRFMRLLRADFDRSYKSTVKKMSAGESDITGLGDSGSAEKNSPDTTKE